MSKPATVHDSLAVANYFIDKAAASEKKLEALQVMKLVYIAHGFTLAAMEKPLLLEDVEAWKYGPVIRRVYDHLPRGSTPLSKRLGDITEDFDDIEISILDQVFEKYGKMSGLALSSLTHQKGTPWWTTWNQIGRSAVIPQDLIQNYYSDLIQRG